MSTQLQDIAAQAKTDTKRKFRSLYRLLNKENMATTFKKLKNKRSAVGIDGQSYANFENCLAENCQSLEDALKEKRYSAPKIRRVNIPKPDGRTRPLGITTISDKVVQAPASAILSAIYGNQFKDFNFGYRPKLGAHQALDYLRHGLSRAMGWVVEMDIEAFFDTIDHDWLMKMLKLRIDDEPFLRLIGKWLKAKVVEEDGKVIDSLTGCPQGGIISPVLANIYLHHVLDLWFSTIIEPRYGEGRCMMVRYADDCVFGFRMEQDALEFMDLLRGRLGKFGLKLSESKTRLVRFSRFAIGETSFDFLGFTLRWMLTREGKPAIRAETKKSRLLKARESARQFIHDNRNRRLKGLFQKVGQKLSGFYAYFGTPGNSSALRTLYQEARSSLMKYLNRRSQRKSYSWEAFEQLLLAFPLPEPRILRKAAQQMSFIYVLF
jgi:group II intron reverse transcriptase/maturase